MSALGSGASGTTTDTVDSAQLQIATVHQDDPLAAPLIEELALEYSSRYGRSPGEQYSALRAYPAEEFAPPGGVLIIALADGVPVAGGAFRQYDATTAELKRIWTASAFRGRFSRSRSTPNGAFIISASASRRSAPG